jgi:GNAT superfamily N-acetyltransferase
MITVIFLKEKPDFVPVVSEWVYNEWYDKKKTTLNKVIDYYNSFLNDDKIPMSLVAIQEGKPVGTVCLWENDLRSRKDMEPWLAALYVPKVYRNRGIARLLINKLTSVCKELGFNKLYLRTETGYDYYKKLGWNFLEQTINENGEKTFVFEYTIKISRDI